MLPYSTLPYTFSLLLPFQLLRVNRELKNHQSGLYMDCANVEIHQISHVCVIGRLPMNCEHVETDWISQVWIFLSWHCSWLIHFSYDKRPSRSLGESRKNSSSSLRREPFLGVPPEGCKVDQGEVRYGTFPY